MSIRSSFKLNSEEAAIEIDSELHHQIYHSDSQLSSETNSSLILVDMHKNDEEESFIRKSNIKDSEFEMDQQYHNNQAQRFVCIDPICFQQNRVLNELNQQTHKDHQIISQKAILKKLQILKCNSLFKKVNPTKVQVIINSLDNIYNEIVKFQGELLSILRSLKIQTLRHINDVKSSFETKYFETISNLVSNQFCYTNATFALAEIQHFKKIKYSDLDYPQFKAATIEQRIKEVNLNNKQICLEHLREWVRRLKGQNLKTNTLKSYNKSTTSFMYKSVSDKKMFSYYLRNHDYTVINFGKTLKRMAVQQLLPVAVIQKKLDKDPIKIKIQQDCPQGITIGCAPLKGMQKNKFDNVYKMGYFLNSKGVLFSLKNHIKNAFKFEKGDVVSLHRINQKIYFSKLRDGKCIQGFYVNLHPYQSQNGLCLSQKYYAAVFLGDTNAEVELLQ